MSSFSGDGLLSKNGNGDLLVGAAVIAAALTMLNVLAEEEEEELRRQRAKKRRYHGGSRTGKVENVKRDFVGAYEVVVKHYFSGAVSLYNKETFERRFRYPKVVVERVWQEVDGCYPFILMANRATGKAGIRPLVRFVACFRMLIYGDCADRLEACCRVRWFTLRDLNYT